MSPEFEHCTPRMSLDTPSSPLQLSKPRRVLACILCQQRKVKCDRKFPCANCVKSRAQCVPATLNPPRRRRRRFVERELLERLRKYEDLLRQNNITFEPLHQDSAREKDSPKGGSGSDSGDERPETERPDSSTLSTTAKGERDYKAKNAWHAMSRGFGVSDNDSDSSHEQTAVKKAWDQSVGNDDHLLFGSRSSTVDLSTMHPDPVQIFRLWQIYLDNVNPLLKVTHTPTLQGRIIEAISSITNINPMLEALIFSIYCMSASSLNVEDCQTMFGSSKEDLLTRYQFGCQQALLNCGFLRSSDRDCLTALYLYLLSVEPSTVPLSLSSMLGVAIRIAQRMGIHSESALAKCSPLEAEMRRRLWWSLTLFDTRIGELASSKNPTLDPTWDCKIPLNVNDSDLRSEMKEAPSIQAKTTEALFAVVRSEVGDFIRHSMFHLDFNNPILKPIIAAHPHSNPAQEGGAEITQLESTIENQYLSSLDPTNPLHFMTLWSTRAHLAKAHLLSSPPSTRRAHALRLLSASTHLLTSPLTKPFRWYHRLYFPFPAYISLLSDLRRRPSMSQKAQQEAWEAMSQNYAAWADDKPRPQEDGRGGGAKWGPVWQVFAGMVLKTWEGREEEQGAAAAAAAAVAEARYKQGGRKTSEPPRIVKDILARRTQISTDRTQPDNVVDIGNNDFPMPMPMPVDFTNPTPSYTTETQYSYESLEPDIYADIPGPAPSTVPMPMHPWEWPAFGGPQGWSGF